LNAPALNSGEPVMGDGIKKHQLENKQKRIEKQASQNPSTYWTKYEGKAVLPKQLPNPTKWHNNICPQNVAFHHPAAATLLKYATGGCPVESGKPWTKQQMTSAVERGPHISALAPDAIEAHLADAKEKVAHKQFWVVLWDEIKDKPPPHLKISPLTMVPHKSRAFRAILDLSFALQLEDGSPVMSLNNSTTKTAPYSAIDQLGHSLMQIVHASAEVDNDVKVFFAKFGIKYGFWRLDIADVEEWNFCYVLPQPKGEPTHTFSCPDLFTDGLG
jgi:hypothetical protein